MFNMFPFLINSLMGNGFNQNVNNNNGNNSYINNGGNSNVNNNWNNNNWDSNDWNSNNSYNNGYSNNNGYSYSSFTSGSSSFVSMIGGTFTSVFNEVFTTLVSNENLINNVVDTMFNNETMKSVLDTLDSITEEPDLKLIDYGDRYLIEGKLVGFDKNDIDIDYESDHIIIKLKKNQTINKGNAILSIFQEGNDLEKSYYVPNVEANKIQAVYNADVLRVYLKKSLPVEKGATVIEVENFVEEEDIVEAENIVELGEMKAIEE